MKTPEELAEDYFCIIQLQPQQRKALPFWKDAFVAGYEMGQIHSSAQPKWISVKERLPKVLESVLVVYAPTNEAKNDHRMECWNWPETEVYEKKFITHWMPLPEPPKENE